MACRVESGVLASHRQAGAYTGFVGLVVYRGYRQGIKKPLLLGGALPVCATWFGGIGCIVDLDSLFVPFTKVLKSISGVLMCPLIEVATV